MILLLTIYKKLLSSCWPLIQLFKKNAIFHWHTPQHESFMALKEGLTTAPVLLYPDFLSCLHRILTLVDIVLALTSLRFKMAKKVRRHREEVLHHRTRGVISNSSNSKVQTILDGQRLHHSCGPPTLKMAFVSAWPNLNTSLVAIDIAGIWL